MAQMQFAIINPLQFQTFHSDSTAEERDRINGEIESLNEARQELTGRAEKFCGSSIDDIDAGSFQVGSEIRLHKLDLLQREIKIRQAIDEWRNSHREDARNEVDRLEKDKKELVENIENDLSAMGYQSPHETGVGPNTWTPDMVHRHPNLKSVSGLIHDTRNHISNVQIFQLNKDHLLNAKAIIEKERAAIVAV